MAIVNRVPDLAAKKFGGAEKVNMSEIQKDTRLTYSTVSSWMKNEISRADFPILNTWCGYFECEVGDILVYVPD